MYTKLYFILLNAFRLILKQTYANLAPLVKGIVFTTSEHWKSEAEKLGIMVIGNNQNNPHGTPFLHDMYLKAFAATDSYFGMYANGTYKI